MHKINFYKNIYNRLPHFLKKHNPPPLGRWNTIHLEDKKRLSVSVNANLDHCGPCGNEHLKTTKK